MYTCLTCGHAEEKPENFMSLNFKRLQKDHVLQIRKRFASEGYKEGIVTKEVDQGKRKGFLGIFKPKPVFQPVLTIRDYFCFLNLIQSYNIRSFCTECNQETDTRLSKLLHRAPEILIVGFSEADDPQPAAADSNFEFRIDLEFDISPFVNQVQNKYELLSVVTKESDALGIDNDVIYIKGAQGEWLRVDLHSIIPIDPHFLQELVSPSILVYQKKLSPDTERKNLESNFTLRDQIAGVELSPLPCFYMEELMVLGIKPEISLAAYICQHRRLMPTYRELYPQKSSPDLLYEWEPNFIQNKRGIKPERKLCGEASPTVRRLLIGTTLLQKPVVEYVLEKVRID